MSIKRALFVIGVSAVIIALIVREYRWAHEFDNQETV